MFIFTYACCLQVPLLFDILRQAALPKPRRALPRNASSVYATLRGE